MEKRGFLNMSVAGADAGAALATPAIAQQTVRGRKVTRYLLCRSRFWCCGSSWRYRGR